MITNDEYLYFCYRALDGMSAIVETLGDDLANKVADLPGANSAYALLTHCIGVADFWAGYLVAGVSKDRDREAEFRASGPVAPLLNEVKALKLRLATFAEKSEHGSPLREEPPAAYKGPDENLTQGGALIHVFEELAQHHGQMEILRDSVLASSKSK
jgi:hypothetical protein